MPACNAEGSHYIVRIISVHALGLIFDREDGLVVSFVSTEKKGIGFYAVELAVYAKPFSSFL